MTAPDHLDPYTLRMSFRGQMDNPADFTRTLLTEVAARCLEAGASLIGHLKCHGYTEAESFHCNLTSLRSGARCSLDAGLPTQRLDLDLAVLVYGVDRRALGDLVAHVADTLCRRASVAWTSGSAPPHGFRDHSH